jgi:purine-nucleoside phosphorylase
MAGGGKNLYQKVQEAVKAVRKTVKGVPQVGIILGTGLGAILKQMEVQQTIDYRKVPHFSRSTVLSHAGRLVFGKFGGVKAVVMEGRFHCYEGYSMEAVTFPVRVIKALGAKFLFISNVAGGLNPQFQKGDLMLISDHINLMGANPLIGPNDERLGIRFPDMIEPYSSRLMKLARESASKNGIPLREGVYLGVMGPCLETRAEYRMMRAFGADAVGMSTVPEVITAVHAGLETLAVSAISDMCLPDALKPVVIEEIIEAANSASPKLACLFRSVIERLPAL